MKVNLLTAGPDSYNARALLYPLLKYKKAISDSGINLKVFLEITSNITDADILIVDSKFFKFWYEDKLEEMYLQLEKFSNNTNLMFFDTTDSSGYVLGDVCHLLQNILSTKCLLIRNSTPIQCMEEGYIVTITIKILE